MPCGAWSQTGGILSVRRTDQAPTNPGRTAHGDSGNARTKPTANIAKRFAGTHDAQNAQSIGRRIAPAYRRLAGRRRAGPDPGHLSWLAHQFEAHYPDDAPQPYIYPTPCGNVQVEWTFGAIEAEVVITLSSGAAAWSRTDTATMGQSEKIST